MVSSNTFQELYSSQVPALQLLMNLGWHYLTPSETLALREGRESNVVLTGVLEPWLHQHNIFERKGERHHFSEKNIKEAVRKLLTPIHHGLNKNNEAVIDET